MVWCIVINIDIYDQLMYKLVASNRPSSINIGKKHMEQFPRNILNFKLQKYILNILFSLWAVVVQKHEIIVFMK